MARTAVALRFFRRGAARDGGDVTRRWLGPLLAGAITLTAVGAPALPAAASKGGEGAANYYLALGTSLSVGFQPDRGPSKQGFVDDLWRSMREKIKALKLHNVGCPGETSQSMITGKQSSCRYAAGSQLDAALSFL